MMEEPTGSNSVLLEPNLEFKSLIHEESYFRQPTHITTFVKIKWTHPVVDLLRDNPLPPRPLPKPKEPPLDSPYRITFKVPGRRKPIRTPIKRKVEKITFPDEIETSTNIPSSRYDSMVEPAPEVSLQEADFEMLQVDPSYYMPDILKQQNRAATKIQRLSRRRYHKKYIATKVIQRIWRGYLARRIFKAKLLDSHAAAIMIQKIVRGHRGRLRYKNWYEVERYEAARRIQSLFRGWVGRKYYKVFKFKRHTESATKIQNYFRCHVARKKLHYLKLERDIKCAGKIQRVWRGHHGRVLFHKYRRDAMRCIIMVQRNWRGRIGRRIANVAKADRRKKAAIKIQRRYRTHLVNLERKRERMAVNIQRMYRGYKDRIKARKYRALLISQEKKRAEAEERFVAAQVERASARIKAFLDSNQGKGVIKQEKKIAYERRQKLKSIISTLSPERQKEIAIREAFHMFDEDGSGYIDPEEFSHITKELATPMTKDEVIAAMKLIDSDSSGEIDFYEFKRWYELNQSNPQQGGAKMAVMVAALKGRKMVLDMMGTTDERMARKTLTAREVEKEKANALATFRAKYPPRFFCPKCKNPLTFADDIDKHFLNLKCKVLTEEQNADPVIDEFFKVHLKTEEEEEREKEILKETLSPTSGSQRSTSISIRNITDISQKKMSIKKKEQTPTQSPPQPIPQVDNKKKSSIVTGFLSLFGGGSKAPVMPITSNPTVQVNVPLIEEKKDNKERNIPPPRPPPGPPPSNANRTPPVTTLTQDITTTTKTPQVVIVESKQVEPPHVETKKNSIVAGIINLFGSNKSTAIATPKENIGSKLFKWGK